MATLKVTNIKNESFAGDQLYLKTDGRLGIGTTSPTGDLEILGSLGLIIGNASGSGKLFADGGSTKVGSKTNHRLDLITNDTHRVSIDTSGNLGIGTTSPGRQLSIVNSSGAIAEITTNTSGNTSALYLHEGAIGSTSNGGAILYDGANNKVAICCGTTLTTERITIDRDNGDVEIGGNLKTNNLHGRNLVINGAMQVAQRGTSATSSSGQYKTVDRFSLNFAGTDEAPTESQHALTSSDTGPWEEGFRHSFHLQNGNQTGGADANDFIQPQYKFEAQDIANSGWNYTSSLSYVTLSFWIKVSVAGDYTFDLTAFDGTSQRYPTSTGNLSANTWTKITKNIPGNSNLQFDLNNAVGLSILWYPFLGTTYTSGFCSNTFDI